MQRRKFSSEAKLKAADAVLRGGSIKAVAADLALHENVLRRWVKTLQSDGAAAFASGGPPKTDTAEVERLKRQIAQLRAERDALAGSTRRTDPKASITRSMLLDATEQIMVEEGYAAVSTRRVAKKVGITAAAVHYYFPTTDDLLIAAFRRKKELHDRGVETALASGTPVRALWKFYTDTARTAIGIEFRAMVNNRKVIRNELAKDIEESRRSQIDGIAAYLERSERAKDAISAICLATIIAQIGRGLVGEEVLGVTYGHAETKDYLARLLGALEDLVEAGDDRKRVRPKNRVQPAN